MNWSLLLAQVLAGVANGGLYVLVASGLTLLWGALGVVNLAHGFMLAAFGAAACIPQWGQRRALWSSASPFRSAHSSVLGWRIRCSAASIALLLHERRGVDEVSKFFVAPLLDSQRRLLAEGIKAGGLREIDQCCSTPV
ncbi:branched-subunit amino acid ABC-type transport system permease component [Bradyrhizobium sp. AZCC 2289]